MKIFTSFRRFKKAARAGVGIALGMLTYSIAWYGWFRPRGALADAVAELLLMGFHGARTTSPTARLLARQVHRGQVGAVFFVSQNIGSTEDVTSLVHLFRSGGGLQPLLAIDHEGGGVQRLHPGHGFSKLPGARDMATSMLPSQARALYAEAGRELAVMGFNVNLGPVLDVHEPTNPGIGFYGRAFDTDPQRIADYGEAFVAGFGSAGVLCAAKHFPGHGRAVSDSHKDTVDISATWTETEMEPFSRLFASPHAPALVMTGHLKLDSIAPDGRPATVSAPIVTGLLRQRLGYQGVVVTDDIDMDAVSKSMNRKTAFIEALAAGNDLIMVLNLFRYDPLLPQRAVGWVRAAIKQGRLSEAQVIAAAERVRKIRRQAHMQDS